jgi:glyoxylase-like metal-dependent hydrolase (beta-lactamase superfamily II)
MSSQIQAQKAPSLKIPSSTKTCQLSIINTTCDLVVPTNYLLTPTIDNYEWMNLPTYSFHIKHESSGKEVLFDLGCRKDWENSVPHIAEMISKRVNGLKIARDVVDTLADGNVKVENLSAFILSHWHYDHNGDVSRLPRSTDLIVGPGFKDKFCPGYPAKEDSPFWDADFEGRNVVEPRFSDDFKIGKFQAHDYFGDGSLYVLNVPGHTTGHISALVRTTPDTFVFLGGDVCHFGGVMRPTPYIPLPDEIPEETPLEKRIARPCPCTAFLSCHPKGEVDGRTVSQLHRISETHC